MACAAPGKLDPRFPFSSRLRIPLSGGDGPYIEKANVLADFARVFILRIPYQAHLWIQLES